jgi:hypothetical protein
MLLKEATNYLYGRWQNTENMGIELTVIRNEIWKQTYNLTSVYRLMKRPHVYNVCVCVCVCVKTGMQLCLVGGISLENISSNTGQL